MGYVYADVEILGTRKEKKIRSLFDSGAFRNYLRPSLDDGETPDDLGFHVFEGPHDAILADGKSASGERVRFARLSVLGRQIPEVRFVILPGLTKQAIIGAETMQALRVRLNLPEETVELLA